ncbi:MULTISPECIES: hypothetical protein [unclassified Rhizobium]|uniref:hypothetical protein n=1 Tax=unclassified Rhizobium TaxID=2613769 RepID=UPI0016163324|nr:MULTISPECIES: hypothetical protein [unclassified Rhizobium]MBB3288747.1 hypothetical protein [Rhizobium sp. BK252]MBB3403489.1 hypothetical protein [Rhizobium sp. BK289]MBB3416326.1 hypothetical protein [Rhizobium sp. BK284]MBB3483952.1 hypothetical protein [Rhizobium sp. BK347]
MAKARNTTEQVSHTTIAEDKVKVAANFARMFSANEPAGAEDVLIINRPNLRAMKMKELNALYDAIEVITSTLCGIVSQPKFFSNDALNAAGEEVERLLNYLGNYQTAVVDTVETAELEGDDPIETEARAWTLIKFSARCEDNLYQFAKLVGEEVANLSTAEHRATWNEKMARAKALG